ncbi:hypothetical protein [Sphingopyxis sp. JAI108]|uniref:hypothetical protein n=1 Tax=Sphingopyxis sp. JAI108 TaxID=2723060 RepID=UPI0015CDA858|nr:hypothetical protein [Sphingopyxis sp. JAI108]NYF33488.1 hypothetical protein [Sphingopyxis sp. JAI108]
MLQFAFAIALALALLIAGNMPALVEAVLLPFLSPSAAWLIGALIFRRVGRVADRFRDRWIPVITDRHTVSVRFSQFPAKSSLTGNGQFGPKHDFDWTSPPTQEPFSRADPARVGVEDDYLREVEFPLHMKGKQVRRPACGGRALFRFALPSHRCAPSRRLTP